MALGAAKQDSGGRYLAGPFDPATKNGRAWRGSNIDADLADANVVLFDAVGNPLLVAIDLDSGVGTAYRAGVALLVPASGGPAVVPGDAANGLGVQLPRVSSIAGDMNVASAATSATLVTANPGRRGLLLTNTDANDAYLYYGTTAALSKFTVKIPAGAYWEMPQPIYTGRIDVIWGADGAGSLIGSEL